MILLIDGYNLLRQIFPSIKGYLDKQRNQLIKELSHYKNKKRDSIKKIILVFDAGPFGHALREVHSDIIVVFSGQKSSADEWIQRYISKHKNLEILLITLDRELKEKCKQLNVSYMGVYEFYNIMQKNLYDDVKQAMSEYTPLEKYEVNDYIASDLDEIPCDLTNEALNLLMEEASISVPPQITENTDYHTHKKKGSSFTLSKKQKKKNIVRKKLK